MYLPHYVMIAINLIVSIILIPEEKMVSSCATYWLQIILTYHATLFS